MSSFSILNVLASGRYDKAILNPKDMNTSYTLSVLCLIIAFLFSSIVFIFLLFFKEFVNVATGLEKTSNIFFLLPFVIFFSTFNSTILSILNKNKEYKEMAKQRVIKSITTAVSNVTLVFNGGLILGEIAGFFVSSISTAKKYLLAFYDHAKSIKVTDLKATAYEYKDFPKFGIAGDLTGVIASELPVFCFNVLFSPIIVGYYSLTKRVLDAPVSLISNSILEVFREKAAFQYNENGDCRPIFLSTLKKLTTFSFIPFIILFLFSPLLFEFLFGFQWKEAGMYAQILSVMYFFRFISSPLTFTYYLANKLKENLFVSVCIVVLVLFNFYCVKTFELGMRAALLGFSLIYSVTYIFLIFRSYKFCQKN